MLRNTSTAQSYDLTRPRKDNGLCRRGTAVDPDCEILAHHWLSGRFLVIGPREKYGP